MCATDILLFGRTHLQKQRAFRRRGDEAAPVTVFRLIRGQKSISGSPVGSAGTFAKRPGFCACHEIALVTEFYPMSGVDEALSHLRSGKSRYRIVLENDIKL